MLFVYFGHILHTVVANLHCVLLKFCEISVYQLNKNVCNIWGYYVVEWWVKPNNISSSTFCFLLLIFGLFKIEFELTFLPSIFEFTFRCVEYFLIRRVYGQPFLDGMWNLHYDVLQVV